MQSYFIEPEVHSLELEREDKRWFFLLLAVWVGS